MRFAPVFLVAVIGCSMPLPSEKPLGRGPLAPNPAAEETSGAAEAVASMVVEAGDGDAGATPFKASSVATAAPVASLSTADAGAKPAATKPASKSEIDSSARVDWAGEYVGRDREVKRLEGEPDEVAEDPHAKTNVRTRSDGKLDIVFVDSDKGTTLCTLEARPTGNTAEIVPGQSCSGWYAELVSLSHGRAVITGKQLTVDVEFPLDIEEEGEHERGSYAYHFEGTKK